MLSFKLKVLYSKPCGEVWLTMFEVTDETGVQPVLPQHFIVYTESRPNLAEGGRTSLQIREGPDK